MKNMRQFGILLLISIGMTVSGIAQVKVISPDERQMNLRFNQAQRFERQGQMEQAAEIYRYLVDNQPNNFSYYNNYVNLLFRQKNLPELERVITRFTQINPRNENAAVDLGKLYYMRGDSALAFREWQAALDKFNHTAFLYNILFNEMIGLRLFDEAEALIKQARTHSNQPDFMTLELANFQIQHGKYITAT
ncbi:MAG: tetratricopeptide repeat protein, partial [Candidatus Neomarinimicrobiota bacterium]